MGMNLMKKIGKTTRLFRYDLNPLQLLYSGSDKQIQGVRSDRVPEELWIGVHNIIQDAVTKTIQRKRNARGQSSCWRSPYKQLRKEKTKAKEKRKDVPI